MTNTKYCILCTIFTYHLHTFVISRSILSRSLFSSASLSHRHRFPPAPVARWLMDGGGDASPTNLTPAYVTLTLIFVSFSCRSISTRATLFWHGGYFRPVYCVFKETQLRFLISSGLRKFRRGISIVERFINLAR